jgi:7-cyano-7-deazaguanine synthase in queuosine biosynthesis
MPDQKYWRDMLNRNGKNYLQNIYAIEEILTTNRGYVRDIPRDEIVIVLLSGGVDSVALIDILIGEWNCRVIPIYFQRNAKNQHWEELAFDYFYSFYLKKYPNNMLESLKLPIEIPTRINKQFLDRNRQKILGLPLRNSIMWNNAFTQAVYLSGKYKDTIRTVVVGSVLEDDASPESGLLGILSSTLNTCVCTGVWYYQILAPFLDGCLGKKWNKLDLLEYAHTNDIPIGKSRSCFGSEKEACGTCLACENRDKAIAKMVYLP